MHALHRLHVERTLMRLYVMALGCAWVVGCSKPSAARAEPECTLTTPLQPGVPGSPGHLIPSDLNPNGASELATLMRRMLADLEALRNHFRSSASAPPKTLLEPLSAHRRMRCAWPTALNDRTPSFDGWAVNYLNSLENLRTAPSQQTFQDTVTACKQCHEHSCEGPLSRIRQLDLGTTSH